jgi:hypothetical protein
LARATVELSDRLAAVDSPTRSAPTTFHGTVTVAVDACTPATTVA